MMAPAVTVTARRSILEKVMQAVNVAELCALQVPAWEAERTNAIGRAELIEIFL